MKRHTKHYENLINPKIWQNMYGSNDVEKKINSYLTCYFITDRHAPPSECLREARDVIKINRNRNSIDSHEEIATYLEKTFWGNSNLVSRIRLCLVPAEEVIKIISSMQ